MADFPPVDNIISLLLRIGIRILKQRNTDCHKRIEAYPLRNKDQEAGIEYKTE